MPIRGEMPQHTWKVVISTFVRKPTCGTTSSHRLFNRWRGCEVLKQTDVEIVFYEKKTNKKNLTMCFEVTRIPSLVPLQAEPVCRH